MIYSTGASKKAYRYYIYDRTIHCHLYMERLLIDVDRGLFLVKPFNSGRTNV